MVRPRKKELFSDHFEQQSIEDFFAPLETRGALLSALLKTVDTLTVDNSLHPVDAYQPHMYTRWGMLRVGDWAKPGSWATEGPLVIDWAHLISNLREVLRYSPLMFQLLWTFKDMIRCSSTTWYDLLVRRLSWTYKQVAYGGTPSALITPKGEPLSPLETRLLKSLDMRIPDAYSVPQMFKILFESNFTRQCVDGHRKIARQVVGSPCVAASTTIIDLSKVKPLLPKYNAMSVKIPIPAKKAYFPLFAKDTPSHEIANILHIREVEGSVEELGVAFFALPTRAERRKHKGCVAINLAQYVEYRRKHTAYFNQPDMGVPITLIDFREYLTEACPRAVYPSGPPMFREAAEKAWPGLRLDDVLFLSVKEVQLMLSNLANLSIVRDPVGRRADLKKARQKRTGAPRVLPVTSPPIPNYDMKGVPVEIIRWGSRTYFNVPWDVRIEPVILKSGVTSRERVTGVYHLKLSDKTFFTLARLRDRHPSPVLEYPELNAWLLSIEQMTRKDFQRFRRQNRQQFIVAQNREGKEHLGGVRFTQEEDTAIEEMMRPGMSKDNQAILLDVCMGRNWKAIQRRARVVRTRLIGQGVFDLEKLPHQNYNAAMRQEIEKAQKLRKVVSNG